MSLWMCRGWGRTNEEPSDVSNAENLVFPPQEWSLSFIFFQRVAK